MSGVNVKGETRQVTTITTTTKTTYKIVEEGEFLEDYEIVEGPSSLRGNQDDEKFELLKEGTESSISSTSEEYPSSSPISFLDDITSRSRERSEKKERTDGEKAGERNKIQMKRSRSEISDQNTSTFSSGSSDSEKFEIIRQKKRKRTLPKKKGYIAQLRINIEKQFHKFEKL